MTKYVGGSYKSFLQQHAFADDLHLTINKASAEIAGVSRDSMAAAAKDAEALRELMASEGIATRDAIADHAEVMVAGFKLLDETTREGFDILHADLREQEALLQEISSTLEIGLGNIEARLGDLGTSLKELISIARTPEQTWACEQYHNAIEASHRRLFPEALESLTRAIEGFGTHPGYRLEHRFHRLLGHVRWAAPDEGVHDLAIAEKAYLDAVRYAESVSKAEASQCLLRAAQLAYGRDDYSEAEKRAQKALSFYDGGQQHFLTAKYMLASKANQTQALDHLRAAIQYSPVYFVMAMDQSNGGSEFTPLEKQVHKIAEAVRDEQRHLLAKVNVAVSQAHDTSGRLRRIVSEYEPSGGDLAELDSDIERLDSFLETANGQINRNSLFSMVAARRTLSKTTDFILGMKNSGSITKWVDRNAGQLFDKWLSQHQAEARSANNKAANEAEKNARTAASERAKAEIQSQKTMGTLVLLCGIAGVPASCGALSSGFMPFLMVLGLAGGAILIGNLIREAASSDAFKDKAFHDEFRRRMEGLQPDIDDVQAKTQKTKNKDETAVAKSRARVKEVKETFANATKDAQSLLKAAQAK